MAWLVVIARVAAAEFLGPKHVLVELIDAFREGPRCDRFDGGPRPLRQLGQSRETLSHVEFDVFRRDAERRLSQVDRIDGVARVARIVGARHQLRESLTRGAGRTGRSFREGLCRVAHARRYSRDAGTSGSDSRSPRLTTMMSTGSPISRASSAKV